MGSQALSLYNVWDREPAGRRVRPSRCSSSGPRRFTAEAVNVAVYGFDVVSSVKGLPPNGRGHACAGPGIENKPRSELRESAAFWGGPKSASPDRGGFEIRIARFVLEESNQDNPAPGPL